jgi:putative ABC transport system substrate-binding protein
MDRRTLLCGLGLGLLATPLAAVAEQAGKVYRIGALSAGPAFYLEEALRQGLHDLGWIEGRNITIEYLYYYGRVERLPDLAAQFVSLNVDVIVAWAAPETEAAKQATKSIPIVFLVHGDPVGRGHVASLAKPGGNITGAALMLPELAAKRLELLKEALPSVARVAILWNAANPVKALDWQQTEVAGRALALTLDSREVRSPDDFPAAFNAIRRARPDALMTLEDPVVFRHMSLVVEFAARERLPAMYGLREYADAGGLMTYGVNLTDLARRGATYVDRILKGAKPANLPVQQPTTFELVINMKTARTLGVTIPPSLLKRADQVIE